MRTLWQEGTRRELLPRARRLTPEHQPRWGKFTADRMLAHLVDAFRMGKLSRSSWGVLGYVHTDHHLRQFGE
jgi:hypothetical protein